MTKLIQGGDVPGTRTQAPAFQQDMQHVKGGELGSPASSAINGLVALDEARCLSETHFPLCKINGDN